MKPWKQVEEIKFKNEVKLQENNKSKKSYSALALKR